jgi:microcystin-dependent protein
MSEPFLSEIKIMAFNFPPKGWALCNGGVMQIAQNQALFSLLGTAFGGDGRQTFGIPDLRGAAPMHTGQGSVIGQFGGTENHTLIEAEMPTHIHFAFGSNANATVADPTGNLLGAATGLYQPPNPPPDTMLGPLTISNVGGNGPHANQQPYLVLSFCIALQGIFPSQN